MSGKYIEVDLYVMGVYRGKRKIGSNSICGRLLSGNLEEATIKTSVMIDALNNIPGVTASHDIDTQHLLNNRRWSCR